jgi:hypothetical protein
MITSCGEKGVDELVGVGVRVRVGVADPVGLGDGVEDAVGVIEEVGVRLAVGVGVENQIELACFGDPMIGFPSTSRPLVTKPVLVPQWS